jgi:hypothetical protein
MLVGENQLEEKANASSPATTLYVTGNSVSSGKCGRAGLDELLRRELRSTIKINRQGAKRRQRKKESKRVSRQISCSSRFVLCFLSFFSWRSRRLGGSFGSRFEAAFGRLMMAVVCTIRRTYPSRHFADTSPGYCDGLNNSASVGTFLAIDSP